MEVRGQDEIARVAERFNQAAARIAGLVDAQRRMLRNASHEIRSPLTRVRMALELVRDSGTPEVATRVTEAVRACDAEHLFADDTILLTAGGSAVFDLVVPLLRTQGLSRPVQGVLRSGCYVTHDHGNYKRFLQLVEKREGLDESLRPALEVWSMVQSVASLSGRQRWKREA